MVASVGPYRFTTSPAPAARASSTSAAGSGSPPQKRTRQGSGAPAGRAPRTAWSRVGTNCATVTSPSQITRPMAPGSFAVSDERSRIRAPVASGVHSSHTDASNEIDVRCSTVSRAPMPNAAACHAVWLTRLRCSTITPFGRPVEPEV